jgi:Anaphase-promoting complex subunit 4 WD40 domain/WD40-like Beta Propeller Repeat
MVRPPKHVRRGFRVTFVAVVALAGLGLVAASYFMLIPLVRPSTSSTASPSASGTHSPRKPACPTQVLHDASGLGVVASIADGELTLIDLGSCKQSVLVASGAAPPVRFSPDGQWLAFGKGSVVPVAGGQVQKPLGSPISKWEWSPSEDLLAGVTAHGAVRTAQPGGQAADVLPEGSGVHQLAFSPDGHRIAVDRVGIGVQVVDLATGKTRTVFSEPDPAKAPEVAGWSPDGRWVLYWRGPVRKEGGPLDAAPLSGGPWVNVFDPVLPYRDFLSTCGKSIAVTGGSGKDVTVGKQIVLNGPPAWRFRNLTSDFTRSWMWPACSPNGRWLAATDSFNQSESANRTIPRALWLLASDGSSRRFLVPGTSGAIEFPRWSSDGTVIMVILRSGHKWSSPGSLLLVKVNPKSGKLVKRAGPFGDLGSAPGPGGHQEWSEVTAWYQR